MLSMYLYLAGVLAFGTFAGMLKQSSYGEADYVSSWQAVACVLAWPVAMPLLACFLMFLNNTSE